MEKIDFSNYKFRCSQLSKLMTDSKGSITEKQLQTIEELEVKRASIRGITEKQAETLAELTAKRDAPPELSKTTVKYLEEIFIEEVFGRKKDVDSKFFDKGTTVEADSISLVTKVEGVFLKKNEKTFENDFIEGTPDIIVPKLFDIKSAWDIWTFIAVKEVSPEYYAQLQGYMELAKSDTSLLKYCLVNTPEGLIYDEVKKKTFYKGVLDTDPLYMEIADQIEKNMTYDEIDPAIRIKSFEVKKDNQFIAELYKKIEQAREYLNSMTL